MMIMIAFAMLATLAALAAAAWILATRAEHLVVLRVDGRATFLLAKQADGRFAVVHPVEVPLALARFVAAGTALRVRAPRAAVAAKPMRFSRLAGRPIV